MPRADSVLQLSISRSHGEKDGFIEVQTILRAQVKPPLLFIFQAQEEPIWSPLDTGPEEHSGTRPFQFLPAARADPVTKLMKSWSLRVLTHKLTGRSSKTRNSKTRKYHR